jgi:hypothetical protein
MMGSKLLRQDENFEGMPTWMATMRKTVLGCVTEDDVKQIVQNQVKKAKEGDQNAIKFVFGQLLGGDTFKGATFVQNNYQGGPDPSKPTDITPGTKDKIALMQRRKEAGLPLTNDNDNGHADLR